MSTILADESLVKAVIVVLLGIIAVLAIAVIVLAIKKNQIIYVEADSSTPVSSKKKKVVKEEVKKVEPEEVTTTPVAEPEPVSQPVTPLVIEPDLERSRELEILNLNNSEDDDANTETKVAPVMTGAHPYDSTKHSGTSVAGYANQVITGLDITVIVGEKSRDAKVTQFPCVLGREADKCDVIVSEPAVSRKHAQFIMEGGEPYIADVSQHNGTYLNEMKLPPLGKARVHEGDVIVLGRAKIRINHYLYE